MSRKPRAGQPGKPVTIRAIDNEREQWMAAAIRQRTDLSSWLRELANVAADQVAKRAPPGVWAAAVEQARGSLMDRERLRRRPNRRPRR